MARSHLAEDRLKRTGEPFQIKMLGMNDLKDILELQAIVGASLDHADHLEPLTPEECQIILSDRGFMVGAYVEGHLIGFRAMLEPLLDDSEHLGIDAGLKSDQLPHVMYSEISAVHPDFRGNGLQTYMGKVVMMYVDKNRFRYVTATVAPFNIPSLKDKLALGMVIVSLKEKYNGKLRYVLFRDLEDEGDHPDDHMKIVSMANAAEQQDLLDKGYRGTALSFENGSPQVVYRK